MNYVSLEKLRARLIGIVDSVLVQYDPAPGVRYGLDESKLEDFAYLVKDLVIKPEQVIEPISAIKNNSVGNKKVKKIVLPKPSIYARIRNAESELLNNENRSEK